MFLGIRTEVPLRRTLVRLATRLALGARRAHFQNWTPHLAIDRINRKHAEVVYRSRPVCRLFGLSGIEANQPDIYVIGSGPSINSQDISRLPPKSAILLNGAIALIGDGIADPLVIAVEDERFVWRHFALMKEKIPPLSNCFFSPGVIRAICELDPEWLKTVRVMLLDDVRKPYLAPRRTLDDLGRLGFIRVADDRRAALSLDPERGVAQAGSVVISALQVAIALKPKHIGLLGIDISNADEPRFYEAAGRMAKSGLRKGQQRILDHLLLAKTICEATSIAVTNHSPVSALVELGFGYDARFARQ